MTSRALSASARLATQRLARAQKRRPRLFFTPSPGLQAFYFDRSTRICVVAANRTGKTRHAIEKLAREMLRRPGIRCRIVAPTNRQGCRIHGKYLAESLGADLDPSSRWNMRAGFNGGNIAVCRNGSTCEITSYEQDPDAHAGASLHIVLLDEPPPPAHYEEALARVFDTEGAVWVTLTAVGRPVKWLQETVKDGLRDQDWTFHQIALSVDNCPWYSRRQVEGRIREARRQPWSFAQRIEGAWEGVSDDRRFAAFQDVNLLSLATGATQGWPMPKRTVHLALAADHGDGPGHAHWVLFGWQVIATTAHGPQVYIRAIAEWTNKTRMSVAKEAAGVRGMLTAIGLDLAHLSFAVGDTNAASKSETARTLNELFEVEFARLMGRTPESATLRVRPARKGPDSIDGGVAICNGLLDGGSLQVSEACVRVVDAMRHWNGKNDDLKHPADAFRYGVNAIVEETGWEPVRLMAA